MIIDEWKRAKDFPFGKSLFTWIVWLKIPYTGSVRPHILELERGYAKTKMRDRHFIRNHLKCVHAAALMNFAELTSGVAFIASLPDNARGIVSHFEMTYLKKARGTLIGECKCEVATTNEPKEYKVQAIIKDKAGDIVAQGEATWKVSPK